jgi:S-formylglutathione hydrolase FrmB
MSGSPWAAPMAGRVDELVIDSPSLAGNPLGDPARRPLLVYVPPGYDKTNGRYSCVYVLQGLTGQVDMWRNRSAFRPTMFETVDRVFTEDGAPPCIVVFVDAWTSLGGSQFLDSPATGRYHTYLCEDVVPFVDARYRTHGDRDHRAVMGKSSGGYGAMVTVMLRPDLFGAAATHAGDCAFELCYQPEFPQCARALTREYVGDYQRFWDDFRSRAPFAKSSDHALLNQWCMAACYSADDDGTVRLPFDIDTGLLVPDVWERWLGKDPVRMVATHADALRSLRTIWVDAGRSDEFFLDLGALAFTRELDDVGVSSEFELFDGRHGGIDWRYPLSLSHLARTMVP